MTWMSVVGMANWESNPGDALPGSLLIDQAFQHSDSIHWVLDGVSDLLLAALSCLLGPSSSRWKLEAWISWLILHLEQHLTHTFLYILPRWFTDLTMLHQIKTV